jgi:hypothetical protein
MRRRRFRILIAAVALLVLTGLIVRSGGVVPPLNAVRFTVRETPLSTTVDAHFHRVETDPATSPTRP